METDLKSVIEANILTPIHRKFIAYQLISTVKYLHSGAIMHRDIKPGNILMNRDCSIKLANFGLARSLKSALTHSWSTKFTDYIANRFFQAPEVVLGATNYTNTVDIWSLGCVIGQLFVGKPLFPGRNTMDQLARQVAVTGPPSQDAVEALNCSFASSMLDSIADGAKKYPNLSALLGPAAETHLVNFLQSCLQFDPTLRPSADVLLNHPFLAPFNEENHEEFDEPDPNIMKEKIVFTLPDDPKQVTVDHYRAQINTLIEESKAKRRLITRPANKPKNNINKPKTYTNIMPRFQASKTTKRFSQNLKREI